VFAYAYGRVGELSPRATAAVLAAAGFVTLILVPQIKYPANPPSMGDAETIGLRTALYFTMLACSAAAAVAAFGTGRRLVTRLGGWNAALAGGVAYIVVMVIVMMVMRPIDEVPSEFSAVVLWRFRLASLGIEAVLWTTLGLGFGALAEHQLSGQARGAVRPARVMRKPTSPGSSAT
jgi:hypothetical protein